ncbi:hypothetical protein NDU88_003512 [Pleurodeles waltl]|uniref:Uncharacterized protein n=1 Tax=Pleurodeles waltl TaxID=8319 RepID=A0AAV7UZ42_PLEWA|nr:hypothetical protein NDU88_003512 [Pleurodeles waltl]
MPRITIRSQDGGQRAETRIGAPQLKRPRCQRIVPLARRRVRRERQVLRLRPTVRENRNVEAPGAPTELSKYEPEVAAPGPRRPALTWLSPVGVEVHLFQAPGGVAPARAAEKWL